MRGKVIHNLTVMTKVLHFL